MAVACNTYASSWFKGEALNMAFGFQLAVVRVGSAISIQILGPIYEAFLPEECALNFTSTTVSSTITTMTPELTSSTDLTSTTTYSSYCEEQENKALGMALTVASASVVLSMFGSIVAALLDKRRSKIMGHDLEEQPKVSYIILKIHLPDSVIIF